MGNKEIPEYRLPSARSLVKKSVINRSIKEKLENAGVDPLEYIATIISGRGFYHPFMKVLQNYISDLTQFAQKLSDEDRERLSSMTMNMFSVAQDMLNEGYAPPELRTKAALDILQYLYAKKKPGKDDDGDIPENQKDLTMEKYEDMFRPKSDGDSSNGKS